MNDVAPYDSPSLHGLRPARPCGALAPQPGSGASYHPTAGRNIYPTYNSSHIFPLPHRAVKGLGNDASVIEAGVSRSTSRRRRHLRYPTALVSAGGTQPPIVERLHELPHARGVATAACRRRRLPRCDLGAQPSPPHEHRPCSARNVWRAGGTRARDHRHRGRDTATVPGVRDRAPRHRDVGPAPLITSARLGYPGRSAGYAGAGATGAS
jgi:hypothetical protein